MAEKETQVGKVIDVLVVDDDRDAAAELTEFLSKAGLACRSAGDGWGALKLIAEGYRPGVVVSDLRMPELDGLQFAEHLNRLVDQDRPEIIFVSGNAGYDDAVEAIRLGARDMLTKPIDGMRLVRAVKSAQLVRQLRVGAAAPARAAAEKSPAERKRATLDDLRAVRKVRSRYFPSELFSDPCWEMLLDLYDGPACRAGGDCDQPRGGLWSAAHDGAAPHGYTAEIRADRPSRGCPGQAPHHRPPQQERAGGGRAFLRHLFTQAERISVRLFFQYGADWP